MPKLGTQSGSDQNSRPGNKFAAPLSERSVSILICQRTFCSPSFFSTTFVFCHMFGPPTKLPVFTTTSPHSTDGASSTSQIILSCLTIVQSEEVFSGELNVTVCATVENICEESLVIRPSNGITDKEKVMSWVAQELNLDPSAYLGWSLAVMKAEGEMDGGLQWFDTKMTADSSCEALFQSLTGTRWLSHSSRSHLYVNPHDKVSSLNHGC